MRLKEKIALVTGASGGLGKAIAISLQRKVQGWWLIMLKMLKRHRK